jgi:hypothetical protein
MQDIEVRRTLALLKRAEALQGERNRVVHSIALHDGRPGWHGYQALLHSGWSRMRRLTPEHSSDRQSELGEPRRETKVWQGVDGEFVAAAAEVLDEGMPEGDHGGGPEALESAHRA